MTSEASRATRAVRTAIESDAQHGAVVPPLHLSSNYAFAGFGQKRQYDYTRSGNPTRNCWSRVTCSSCLTTATAARTVSTRRSGARATSTSCSSTRRTSVHWRKPVHAGHG